MDEVQRENSQPIAPERGEPKTVLITGGAGSLGTELVRVLLEKTSATIRVLDNNEERMHLLFHRFRDQGDRLRDVLCDVRDYNRVAMAMENVDFVFHLAASKHVWIARSNPMEVKGINLDGTETVLRACWDEMDPEVFMYVSTDKAVHPSTFYGKSKAMAEYYTLNFNNIRGDRPTAYSVFRPGNFFLSSGNVIEQWIGAAHNGGEILLCRGDMKRYYIGVGQAAELLYTSSLIAKGGEIFIPKMKEYTMEELAGLFSGKVKFIDPRPGDKLREELYTEEEAQRLDDIGNLWRVRTA